MKKPIAKKTIILFILIMLKKGSSREKPITQTNIVKVLNSMDIACDRKTVGRNIKYLIDFGCPIIKVDGFGYYYDNKNDNLFNFT